MGVCGRSRRGFSFIELMLAAGMLSACGLAVMQSLSMSGAASERSSDMIEASLFARELLEEARFLGLVNAADANADPERREGIFSARIEQREDARGGGEVMCTVRWERRQREHALTFLLPDTPL